MNDKKDLFKENVTESLEALEHMWQIQRDFQKNFMDLDNMEQKDRVEWFKTFALQLHSEISEALRTVPGWKHHRRNFAEFARGNLVEELVDSLKFLINLCLMFDIKPEEIVEEFNRKTSVVLQRYHQEMSLDLLADNNIVGIDIDGVLAYHEKAIVDYTNDWLRAHGRAKQNEMVVRTFADIDKQLSVKDIEEIKFAYRESGAKRTVPVMPGAVEFTKKLKKMGFTIVMLSSRPVEEHARIAADTLVWLKKNGFIYDALFFSKDKNLIIVKRFPNCKFQVEDTSKYANTIASAGYRVYLLTNPQNERDSLHSNVIRVANFEEIIKQEAKRNELA